MEEIEAIMAIRKTFFKKKVLMKKGICKFEHPKVFNKFTAFSYYAYYQKERRIIPE